MISRFATLACTLCLCVPLSSAAPLNVGGSTSSFDVFSSASVNAYSGTFVAGGTTNASSTLWSGVLSSAVFRNSSGTLDFLYQFSNNATSSQVITQLIESNFSTYAINDIGYIAYDFDGGGNGSVNFKAGTAGDSPLSASRSVGGSVAFNFGSGSNAIGINESSYILMVSTNATQWTAGQVQIMDNNINTADPYYMMYQPYGAAVPEPATFALIGLGLVVLSMLGRKHS